jgi:hypothetical protein
VIRRLVISLVLLAVILAGADFGFRAYAESVVAKELQSSLHLSEQPKVTLNGFPFTSHVITGDLPSATFQAATVAAKGVSVDRVHVTLRDVTFPTSRLITKGGGTIRAKNGDGTAAITGASLTHALRSRGFPITVRISDGRASIDGAVLDVSVHGRSLVVRTPALPVASVTLPLPEVISGLRYTAARFEGSQATLSFRLRNPVFRIPS